MLDRPSYSVTVRLPTRTEYWHTEALPRPGATISYCGQSYFVVSCEQLNGSGYILTLAEPELEPEPDPGHAGGAQPLAA
jgi:hypothetical protein